MEQEIKELVIAGYRKAEEYLTSGHPEEASVVAEQVLKVDPDCHEAKLVFGLSLAYKGHTQESKKYILKTIEERPDDFRAYNNFGLVSSMEGDYNQAIFYFKKSSTFTQELGPLTNLALELAKIGLLTEAEEYLSYLSSKTPVAKFNYAGFLHSQRRLEEAEKVYREIDEPIAKCNLAKLLLLKGQLEEGFKLLEYKWQAFPHLKYIKSQLKSPYWDGTPGKRVVLFCEEGRGDYIMFARFADKAAEICKEVYLDVGDSLKEAFSNLGIMFYSDQEVDACCSVISLPNLVGYDIPPPISLKCADINLDKYKLNLKIGLCWCGSPMHPDDSSRSVHLNRFESLSKMENSKWISCGWAYGEQVRHGRIVNWEKDAEKVSLVDAGIWQKDFSLTAGIINGLDLVITVDTATAHVAGSLGKETWLLLPYNGEWRWGLGDSTQWYPSIKIFRQEKPGDWSSLLKKIESELWTFKQK